MEEYKMRRGEYLEERVPDMEAKIEEHFGPPTATEEYRGSDLHVVEEPKNPVFERIVAGAVSYSGKKDTLAVEFEESDPSELTDLDNETMSAAIGVKNDFLLECTGRDAKSRRESMKRAVEDDETPDNV